MFLFEFSSHHDLIGTLSIAFEDTAASIATQFALETRPYTVNRPSFATGW
jgi:hypothetical protein